MTGTDVRRRAWKALAAVDRGASLEPVLDEALDGLAEPRDRALCADLIRGTLQWRGRYDRVIDAFARNPKRIKADVRNALRLGLHQILTLDRIPPHAAVDLSVRLAVQAGGKGQGGFVNGLLRSVLRRVEGADDPWSVLADCFIAPGHSLDGHLAGWTSHPRWLVKRWLARHAEADVRALLDHDNSPPALELHVLPGGDRDALLADLASAGHDATPGDHPSVVKVGGRPSRDRIAAILAGHRDLIVQDGSVQQATEWLVHGIEGPVLDMCAAPGGKTVHLRRLLPGDQAVVALDLEPGRLGRLRENLERVEPGPVLVLSADGRRAPFADGTFGAVLLDGPCSGTGVLRHHPDGRWRLKRRSLDDNHDRLTDLADEAARLLRPGGLLLFATCSLEPEEGEDVLRELSRRRDDLTPAPGADGESVRRWLPWRDGGDGFFAARLRKEG